VFFRLTCPLMDDTTKVVDKMINTTYYRIKLWR